MLRRCIASLALLPAAFIAAALPSSASAASIVTENGTKYAYYELVNTEAKPVTDLIVTSVVPPNSVQPLDPTTSPLTIVGGSSGFDPNNLQVFLSPTDPSSQELALQFGNGGLAPGGVLNFKVSLEPSYSSATAPTLTLQPPGPVDLSPMAPELLSYTPTSVNGAPPATPVTNAPEPVSLALWSALAGVGLLRARAFRRSRRAAAGV